MDTAAGLISQLLRERGPLRSADLEACGIKRSQIARQLEAGRIVRIARGLYALSDRPPSEHEALLIVSQRIPHGVFCLLTALRIHDLTTQAPFEVWVAIGRKDRAPKLDWPTLRVVRFNDALLEAGVETHQVDGTAIRVTNVPRTVVDCFKYRNKIGVDVAVEALRDAVRQRRTTLDEIWSFAALERVSNVMKSYLAAIA